MTTAPSSLPALTQRQSDRSAGATIAGYQYQFERSVVEVLNLQDGEKLRVEGIEDIDIWTETPSVVQVKYFHGQRWSISTIRSAVFELLKSFISGLHVEYVLYVHFGSGDTPPEKLSLEELKECLTYRPRNKPTVLLYEGINDEQLEAFIDSFQIVTGVSLDEQRVLTSSAIADALGCDLEEAELLHRMRAVQFLYEIAIKKKEELRVVTRVDLLKLLGDREIFYNRWHKKVVGRERFIGAATKKLKSAGFSNPNTYRGILLEVSQDSLDAVARLASELAHDMNGSAKRRTTAAKPWTIILRGSNEHIAAVKKALIEEEQPLNDGFEHLHFSPELFIEPAVVKSTGKGDRLSKASHVVRIISEESMKRVAETSFQLSRLVALAELDAWHIDLARVEPIQIYEVKVDEITEILRRVTT